MIENKSNKITFLNIIQTHYSSSSLSIKLRLNLVILASRAAILEFETCSNFLKDGGALGFLSSNPDYAYDSSSTIILGAIAVVLGTIWLILGADCEIDVFLFSSLVSVAFLSESFLGTLMIGSATSSRSIFSIFSPLSIEGLENFLLGELRHSI